MSDPSPAIPLEYADSRGGSSAASRTTLQACEAVAAACCAAAWVALVFWESVLVTGAVVSATGLAFVVGGAVARDRRAVLIGAAHVLACAAVVALARYRGWAVREVQVPFVAMGVMYTASALSLAAWWPAARAGAARRRHRGERLAGAGPA
jgi:hypothetical protein